MSLTISSTAKKIAATLSVAAIFIFFWINVPIQELAAGSLESIIETEYAKVLVVGENQEKNTHGTIQSQETHGHGWQLLKDKDQKPTSGLLSSKQQLQDANQRVTQQLITHAELHYNGTKIQPLHAHKISAVTFENADGKFFYTETQHILPHILGYGGPINLGILFDYQGQIQDVIHISSKETQSYLRTIAKKGYYSQYPQLKMNTENTIDAVSGATISTKAMADIVDQSVELITPMITQHTIATDDLVFFGVEAKNTLYWIAHALIIGLMFLYGFQKKYKKTKKHITILSVLSVV
jgi:NosR/NirI family nitrous oxide reductase transcriptional regulator